MSRALTDDDDTPGAVSPGDASEGAGPPASGAPPSAGGALSAFSHRNFRVFFAGQILSLAGTWMQSTAQGWLVLELTGSSLLLGVVMAVTTLPTLLFTLYAGAVADRMDKRRIILWSQVAAAILSLTLAVLTDTERITYPVLLAIAFGMGTVSAFEVPTRQSFFVELVGKRDLPNAIALNSSAFNGTRIVGPAVAGWLIGAAGIAACFYANAVSYAAVIAGLLMIRLPPFQRPERGASTLENIREGLAYIRGDRLVRTLVWLIAAMSILAFPYSMLLPVIARDVLRVGAPGLGSMLAAGGAGALAGAIWLAGFGSRFARGKLILAGSLVFAATLVAFSLSRAYPLSLALLAVAGFTMILNNASVNALLQSAVPNQLRGRVMSVYVFMFVGMAPLGSLQAGALARWAGAPFAIGAGAAAFIVVVLVVAWRIPELRAAR